MAQAVESRPRAAGAVEVRSAEERRFDECRPMIIIIIIIIMIIIIMIVLFVLLLL